MKYAYSLLVILCFSINSAFAQITLTKANKLILGETYTSILVDEPNFDVGDAGANITWDFSNLTELSTSTAPLVDPATLSNGNLFPQATAGAEEGGTEAYYYQDDTGMGFYGAVTSTASVVYTDPQDWIRFPMTFMDSFTDDFEGTITTSTSFVRKGTAEVVIDAYGTLITPAGTFEDVVRVYTYMDYGDEFGGTELFEYIETRYLWYDVRSGLPLFTYADLEAFSGNTITVSYLEASPLNTRSLFAEDLQLNVFPNPTSDWLTLDYSLTDQSEVGIAVTNLLGQEVLQVSQQQENAGSHQSQVDVSALATGTYFVRITIEEKVATYKVLVER